MTSFGSVTVKFASVYAIGISFFRPIQDGGGQKGPPYFNKYYFTTRDKLITNKDLQTQISSC